MWVPLRFSQNDEGVSMKFMINHLIVAVLAIFAINLAVATEEHGTGQEAISLVKKTIEYYKKNGAEKTYAAINAQDPEFKVKDLYVFAAPLKQGGVLLAHGANTKMVGKDLGELKDADGVFITKKIYEMAQSKEGKGWVDYKWPNPVSKQIEQKSTYVERVDDIYFACGIYK
jgi:cytochrome c